MFVGAHVPKSVLLPVFGQANGLNSQDVNYAALCDRQTDYEQVLGMAVPCGNAMQDYYMIGHPSDILQALTTGNRGIVPWGMKLRDETVISDELRSALLALKAERRIDPRIGRIFGYDFLRELSNPANDAFAEDSGNYFKRWAFVARDGKVPTLQGYNGDSVLRHVKWYHHTDAQPNKFLLKEQTDMGPGVRERPIGRSIDPNCWLRQMRLLRWP